MWALPRPPCHSSRKKVTKRSKPILCEPGTLCPMARAFPRQLGLGFGPIIGVRAEVRVRVRTTA